MATPTHSLDELVSDLPPELQDEVREFIRRLLDREVRPKANRLLMSWAGGLREYRDQYTSLELQKKALEWWGG